MNSKTMPCRHSGNFEYGREFFCVIKELLWNVLCWMIEWLCLKISSSVTAPYWNTSKGHHMMSAIALKIFKISFGELEVDDAGMVECYNRWSQWYYMREQCIILSTFM